MGRRFQFAVALLVAMSIVVPAGSAGAVAYGRWIDEPSRTVPWVLPIFHSDRPWGSATAVCSATAVGPQVLVTAAACVDEPGFYYVDLHGDRLNSGRRFAIEAVLPHPRYRPSSHLHDVALLRTLRPLTLHRFAKLAPPAVTRRLTSAAPPKLTLYGWGRNEDGSSTTRLRQGIVLPKDAAAAEAFRNFRPGPMLAAGRPRPKVHGYVRACGRDQGGPLIVRRDHISYVVGVTSWGAPRCRAHKPTVFTAVSAHRSWLASAVQALPDEAARDNRAVPEILSTASISGTMQVGSTLTCNPGTWTANATGFGYHWEWSQLTGSGPAVKTSSTGPTYTLTGTEIGFGTCLVEAASQAGSMLGSTAQIDVPMTQSGVGLPSITGVPAFGAPLPPVGTVVSCKPPAYSQAGVIVSTRWTLGPISTERVLGTGPSLTLTADVLRAVAGQSLWCTTSASVGGFWPDVRSTSAPMSNTDPPFIDAVTVSPHYEDVPPTALLELHCAADRSGDPYATVGYSWWRQAELPGDDGALSPDAQPLGTGPDYVMSPDDVDAVNAGEWLICRVTADSWQGTDSWWDYY